MITGSIALALVAVVLLAVGLASGDNSAVYYYSSIVASVLAGFALFGGLRHTPGAQLPEDDFDGPRGVDRRRAQAPGVEAAMLVARTARTTVAETEEPPTLAGWEEGPVPASPRTTDDSGLRDEPSEQVLTPPMRARVARLEIEVSVIDGRPRYHVPSCMHLLGRAPQRLPVIDVVELGFTPCADCTPVTELLAAAAHV